MIGDSIFVLLQIYIHLQLQILSGVSRESVSRDSMGAPT